MKKRNLLIYSLSISILACIIIITGCNHEVAASNTNKTTNSEEKNVVSQAVSEVPNPDIEASKQENKTKVMLQNLGKYKGVSLTQIEELTTKSPDGTYLVQIWKDDNNSFYYSVTCNDYVVIRPSAFGMKLEEIDLTSGLDYSTGNTTTKEINETYTTNSLSADKAINHCNERRIALKKDNASFDFVMRAYDDGFAFRYENVKVGSKENLTVLSEKSEYVLPINAVTWFFGQNGTYEGDYRRSTYIQTMSTSYKISTPLLATVGDYKILISEAGVFNNNGDYCKSALKANIGAQSLRWCFGLARDPKKEVTNDWESPGHIDITKFTTRNGFNTPWRAAIISADYNKYLTSTLISNLNPEPDQTLFADTSWIKPGKVAWSWWSESNQQSNYNKHIEYIDFASNNGWEYVCLDLGWESFQNRIKEMADYAKAKKVGLFVWFNYRSLKDPQKTDAIFAKMSQAGVVGLKLDYFESDEQSVLITYEQVAQIAAKHKLMILYHGCIVPCGEYRTYPNILTMEAVQGEEFRKWGTAPSANACLMYPFTRNVLGSMDYTPAIYKIDKVPETFGFSIAKAVVYNSALQHFSNSAAIYKTYLGLPFLNNVPTTWDQSLVLEAEIGEYLTYARKNGDNWFIGSMTLNARTMNISLSFLEDGDYNAYIYKDNEDGSKLVLDKKVVNKSDQLSMDLLAYGGTAIMLTKSTIETDIDTTGSPMNATKDNATSTVTNTAAATIKKDNNFIYYEAENKDNTLSGAAKISSVENCSGKFVVGYVGNGANNSIQFNNVKVSKKGTYKIKLAFCSAEARNVVITVNKNKPIELKNLSSGSWTDPKEVEFTVKLQKGTNILTISNPSAYTPDIDYIAVSKKTYK